MSHDKVAQVLEALEATEANLQKLEAVWSRIKALIPAGPYFGNDPEHENLRREYAEIVSAMPSIGGKKLSDTTLSLNEIGQARLDALEIDEIRVTLSTEATVLRPEHDLAEYRYLLRKKRRELVGALLRRIMDGVDSQIRALLDAKPTRARDNASADEDLLDALRSSVSQIDRLLGSSSTRPPRWGDLRRHVAFGQWKDVQDIDQLDWPVIRPALLEGLRGEHDPVPVPVASLDDLEALSAGAAVPTALAFEVLSAENFERLLFALVSLESGYENPEWLTKTNAPDRGRDISVQRVINDGLAGTRRERVIIQCKHWRETSVGVAEFATLKEQVLTWEPPRVDVLVIATTGRFTSDAVLSIERHNTEAKLPRLEMWPDSHMELLLARRPAIVAQFGLRRL